MCIIYMTKDEVSNKKLKRTVKIISVILFIVLLGLTFSSRAFYTATLPRVETANVSSTRLRYEATVAATIGFTDKTVIRAQQSLQIIELFVEVGNDIQTDQPLAQFNMDSILLMEEQLQHQILSLEQIDIPRSRGRVREALVRQRDLLKQELDLLTSHNLEDGMLLAPVSGRITDINVEQWQYVSAGDELFTVIDEGSRAEVFWYMDDKESEPFLSEVRSVFLFYDTLGDDPTTRQMVINNSVGRWDTQREMFRYSFLLDENSLTLNGIRGTVHMSVQTQSFNTVVPSAAIFEDISGVKYVLVLDTRDNLFGSELYVRRVNVLVLEESRFETAVEAVTLEAGQRIVISSSIPLLDGDTVWSTTLGLAELDE